MARKSKLNAGVIGLGIIGSRIAANLRSAGFQVYVWNRTPKPAPNFLASPAEVAAICDVVQIVVADTVALFGVVDAMSGVLSKRHTVICSATVGAEATVEAARMVAASGAKFLDAPFTGSKGAAEKGELVYFIGGDDETFRQAEPMLKATSKTIVRIGEVGHAATVKVATNMIAAVTVQALAEACVIVKKSGIDPRMLAKAMESHGARSPLIDMKLPAVIEGNYDTNFSVKHMFKDMQLAIRVANNADIDIPATTATAGVLYGSINNGWADLDYAAVAKFYEEAASAPVPFVAEEAEEEEEKPADADETAQGEEIEQIPAGEAQNGPASSGSEDRISDEKLEAPEAQSGEAPAQPGMTEPVPAAIPVAPPIAETPIIPPAKPEKSKGGWFSSRRDR